MYVSYTVCRKSINMIIIYVCTYYNGRVYLLPIIGVALFARMHVHIDASLERCCMLNGEFFFRDLSSTLKEGRELIYEFFFLGEVNHTIRGMGRGRDKVLEFSNGKLLGTFSTLELLGKLSLYERKWLLIIFFFFSWLVFNRSMKCRVYIIARDMNFIYVYIFSTLCSILYAITVALLNSMHAYFFSQCYTPVENKEY